MDMAQTIERTLLATITFLLLRAFFELCLEMGLHVKIFSHLHNIQTDLIPSGHWGAIKESVLEDNFHNLHHMTKPSLIVMRKFSY
jgi:hypothetical protein